jgi:NAD(P)H-nitrite reductase large subunit
MGERGVFACICAAVDEQDILAAVDQGADSIMAVASVTRAGTGCGSCHDHIEDLIELRCGACPLAGAQVAFA